VALSAGTGHGIVTEYQLHPGESVRTTDRAPGPSLLPRAGLLAAVLVTLVLAGDARTADRRPAVFQRDVRPVLKRLCFRCHGASKREARLRLDTLNPDLVKGPDAETWHDVLNRLNLGEMPPKKATQPTTAQRRLELRRARQIARSTGGRVVMRRLTRYEYNNTMRDLLGIDLDFAENLPPEPPSRDGFQNNGAALGISPLQVEYYLKAARLALSKVIVTGPRPEVIKHQATRSAKVRRVKGQVSNRLGPDSRFLVRLMEFPREGEVLVRVRAHAVVPPGAGYPRMRVTLGLRADVRAAEKTLAEVDVSDEKPRTFTFRGRIEEFPLPGHNPKFPGLQVSVYNAYEGDMPATKKKKKKKKKRKKKNNVPPDPTQPVIVIESVDFEGPVFKSWPPRQHARIFFDPSGQRDERRYARRILARFMTRAYRRPVEETEVAGTLALFDKVRTTATSFETAMRDVLAMVLVSPEFLYLVEPRDATEKKTALNGYELASRLSYFLWSTMPDQHLFELAASGKLSREAVLEGEVHRMIADSRSWQLVEHFTDQWLDLSGLDRVAVNPEYHPDFDDRLKQDMRGETQHFFAEILHKDLSCLNLLESDFTMLNRRLARHYGIAAPLGGDLQRVALPGDSHRGGLLTHGSFLLSNSNGGDSHPIKRAVWLLDRLLDDPPPPPPPDVPDLDPDQPDLAKLSLKQQLETHRQKEACNNCHRRIDPWGVAFENFDAIGRWRTEVPASRKNKRQKKPVDSVATLPDGKTVNGVGELKSYLVETRSEQFARALVKRLLTYSLGRSLEFADEKTVDALARQFIKDDYRLSKLITAIVTSEPFGTK